MVKQSHWANATEREFSVIASHKEIFTKIATMYTLSLLALFALASSEILSPIPLSPTGNAFTRGLQTSNVVVDLFIDLGCSDCMNDWPMLSGVIAKYSDTVKFNYHLFPLPYHTWAFLLAKSANVVDLHSTDPTDTFSFIDYSYLPDAQAMIYNGATTNMTYGDVQNIVADWVVASTSVSADVYNDAMTNDQNAELNTRYSWKYSTLQGVSGTPAYIVNGVSVIAGLDDEEGWDKMIASLLPSTEL